MTMLTQRTTARSTRRSRHGGFALVLAVTIAAILLLLAATVIISSDSNTTSSTSNIRTANLRQLANAGLQEFAARAQSSTDFMTAVANATASGLNVNRTQLADYAPLTTWAKLAQGVPAACTTQADFFAGCYHLTVTFQTAHDTTNPSSTVQAQTLDDLFQVKSAIVQVDAVLACRDATADGTCVRASYQMHMRDVQGVLFLYYTQYSTLAPERYADLGKPVPTDCTGYAQRAPVRGADCNESVDFTSKDFVTGPVFTNDSYIPICGSPTFEDVIISNPTDPLANNGNAWQTSTGCGTPSSPTLDPTKNPAPTPVAARQGTTGVVGVGSLVLPQAPDGAREFGQLAGNAGYLKQSGGPDVKLAFVAPANPTDPTATSTISVSGATNSAGASVTSMVLPPSGVIYVAGNVTLASETSSSILSGKLSLFATGNITVAGNICYLHNYNADPTYPCNLMGTGQTGGSDFPHPYSTTPGQSNTQDLLGLTAIGDIIINAPSLTACPVIPAATSTPCSTTLVNGGNPANRRLDAVMVALGGSGTATTTGLSNGDIHVAMPTVSPAAPASGWTTNRYGYDTVDGACTSPTPTLQLNGAIASRYEPVFGGYNQATGCLVAGYSKNFMFDQRFTTDLIQPPFLINSTQSRWEQLDTTQVPACATKLPTNLPSTSC